MDEAGAGSVGGAGEVICEFQDGRRQGQEDAC